MADTAYHIAEIDDEIRITLAKADNAVKKLHIAATDSVAQENTRRIGLCLHLKRLSGLLEDFRQLQVERGETEVAFESGVLSEAEMKEMNDDLDNRLVTLMAMIHNSVTDSEFLCITSYARPPMPC